MKLFKRSISTFLILLMMLCLVPAAAAEEPAYLGFDAAVLEVREQLLARKTNFDIYYQSTEAPTEALLADMVNRAMAHTGNSDEGDYLEKHIGDYAASLEGFSEDNKYLLKITYTVSYYTTLEQEQAVGAAIADLIAGGNLSGASDYEKAEKIYNYITSTVTYDYTNLKNDAYKLKYSAYAALINKTAVCQGYASLFYRMALSQGLDCRVIYGTSREENHAWNIVKLDGKYYYVDATWDAGRPSYDFFLKGSADFDEHLADSIFDTAEFKAAYPISETNYGQAQPSEPAPTPTPSEPAPTPTPSEPAPTPTPVEIPFSDVAANSYCRTPVAWAIANNITKGTSATTFSPNDECTRGQVVTFLWRAAGSPEPQTQTNPFTDIKAKDYYYKAVLWAVEQGITTGVENNKFDPSGICTRAQVATFLWRSVGRPAASQALNPFKDLGKGYYYDAVLWAVEHGVTKGVAADRFAPNDKCTRGQIVTFLYRHFT